MPKINIAQIQLLHAALPFITISERGWEVIAKAVGCPNPGAARQRWGRLKERIEILCAKEVGEGAGGKESGDKEKNIGVTKAGGAKDGVRTDKMTREEKKGEVKIEGVGQEMEDEDQVWGYRTGMGRNDKESEDDLEMFGYPDDDA